MWLEYVLRGWLACGLAAFAIGAHYMYLVEKHHLLFDWEIPTRSERRWCYVAVLFGSVLLGPIVLIAMVWTGVLGRYFHTLTLPLRRASRAGRKGYFGRP